jgi:hypothetical protein
MKSILLASKPPNNTQLSVGSQIRRNESSAPYVTQTSSTRENNAEAQDNELLNKLNSNSIKQVIRSRCVPKSDVEKLRRVASDVFDSAKGTQNDERLSRSHTSDNSSEVLCYDLQPLILDGKISAESDKSVKLINLRKKNGTTLIFQKKASQKHPKTNEYQELESHKKRRSLQQWPSTGLNSSIESNNTNRHSWYDTDYYPRAIEEEFDDNEVSVGQMRSNPKRVIVA